MATITVDTGEVAPVFADRSEIIAAIAGEALEYGDPVFIKTGTGTAFKGDGAAAGTAAFAGYCLTKAGVGQAIDIMKRGHLYGFAISGLAYGARTYVGNTGVTADVAGTVSVASGTVVPLSDSAKTKVLYVDADWLTGAYAAG